MEVGEEALVVVEVDEETLAVDVAVVVLAGAKMGSCSLEYFRARENGESECRNEPKVLK